MLWFMWVCGEYVVWKCRWCVYVVLLACFMFITLWRCVAGRRFDRFLFFCWYIGRGIRCWDEWSGVELGRGFGGIVEVGKRWDIFGLVFPVSFFNPFQLCFICVKMDLSGRFAFFHFEEKLEFVSYYVDERYRWFGGLALRHFPPSLMKDEAPKWTSPILALFSNIQN